MLFKYSIVLAGSCSIFIRELFCSVHNLDEYNISRFKKKNPFKKLIHLLFLIKFHFFYNF